MEIKARMHLRGSLSGDQSIKTKPEVSSLSVLPLLCIYFILLSPCRLTLVVIENECTNCGQNSNDSHGLLSGSTCEDCLASLFIKSTAKDKGRTAYMPIISRVNMVGRVTLHITNTSKSLHRNTYKRTKVKMELPLPKNKIWETSHFRGTCSLPQRGKSCPSTLSSS